MEDTLLKYFLAAIFIVTLFVVYKLFEKNNPPKLGNNNDIKSFTKYILRLFLYYGKGFIIFLGFMAVVLALEYFGL